MSDWTGSPEAGGDQRGCGELAILTGQSAIRAGAAALATQREAGAAPPHGASPGASPQTVRQGGVLNIRVDRAGQERTDQTPVRADVHVNSAVRVSATGSW